MTASCSPRLLSTARGQQQRRCLPARYSRALVCGVLMLVGGQLAESQCLADDGLPSWMKPLMWSNPESSNTATTPLPLPQVKSPWLKPLHLRGDVKVPPRQVEYTANELDFEMVSRPFHWANPQDAASRAPQQPLTDAEQIEFEKEHFVWIRPFYWNNEQEAEDTMPLEQQYIGTSEQQLSSNWMKPFLWTNNTRPRAVARRPRTKRTAAVANDDWWLAKSAAELYRLPPLDGSDTEAAGLTTQPRTVAFMYQEGSLPTPAGEQGTATEHLQTPAGHPEADSDAEDLAGLLPFEDLQEGEAAEGEGFDEGEGVIAGAETLGSEPEDNYTLQFLRADTVLLEPGEMQFDYGVTYTLADVTIPAINGSSELEHARFRQREMLIPLEIRYGFTRRLQLFANIPFGWSNIEFAFSDFELFENDGGLGDITFGGTFLLREGDHRTSDVVLTMAATAPTGIDPLVVPAGQPGVPSLGSGTWSMSASLLHIRTYDPMVIFYGFGTRQHFTRDLNGQSFRPGQEYNYQMGVGFAVNSEMTLSTRFSGAYITESRLASQRFLGSIREPMTIGLALTIAQCQGLVEPFIDFGLTAESIETRFGVIWTRF